MAANLAGMFAQLNQGIQQNPLVTGAGQGLLDGASQGLGGALGTALGQDPYNFMNQGAKQRQGIEELAEVDMATAAGLEKAAEIYGKMGNPANQMATAQMAQKQKLDEAERARLQKERESLAARAEKAGLTEVAGTLLGGGDVKEARELILDMEKTDLLAKRGVPARLSLAKSAGISQEDFYAAGLDKVPTDDFKSVIEGQKGDSKAFLDAQGKPVMRNESIYGRVYDPVTKTHKYPSELGLTPAPQVSKVTNMSKAAVEKLQITGVDNIIDLHSAANDAQQSIDIIDKNLGLIDDMATGLTAPVTQWMKRLGSDLGMDTEAPNAEVFTANAGQLVAKEIKAFGAGTGLSDKDREFAENMAAGKITATPEALKRILEIRKQVAQNHIQYFNDTKTAFGKTLAPEDRPALDAWQVRSPLAVPEDQPRRRKYNPETGQIE